MPQTKILLARVSAAHGIKGEVKLQVFAENPDNLVKCGPLESAEGRVFEIARLKPAKDHFIAALKGIADRNQAEALRGTELYIDRARLPDPGEGEVYANDLIGLPVRLKDGTLLGTVAGVPNFGAGDLLEVAVEGRRDTALIPYAEEYVVSEDGGAIVVDLPEGFLDPA
jgi:16S rRNA processing protein RimM